MPGAQCTRSPVCAGGSQYAHGYSQRRHRKHPAFPTQWFYRIEWFHVPGWADKTSARLSISNGCQDHTTSPYASAPFVLRARSFAHEAWKAHPARSSRPTLPRPPHPASRFATIGRNVPLHRGGMAESIVVICPTAQDKRVRHFGATGKSGMGGMRALPVGRKSVRSSWGGLEPTVTAQGAAAVGVIRQQTQRDGGLRLRLQPAELCSVEWRDTVDENGQLVGD